MGGELEPPKEEGSLVEARMIEEAPQPFEPPVYALGRLGDGARQVAEGKMLSVAQGIEHMRQVRLLGRAPGRGKMLDTGKDLGVRSHTRRLPRERLVSRRLPVPDVAVMVHSPRTQKGGIASSGPAPVAVASTMAQAGVITRTPR